MCSKILLVTLLVSILVSYVFGEGEQNISKYTHEVSIRRAGKHICGGSFVGNDSVLTAAQCFHNQEGQYVSANYTVILGLTNVDDVSHGHEVIAKLFYMHKRFAKTPMGYLHDIAVLKLNKEVNAETLALPGDLEYFQNVKGTTTGWGFSTIENVIDKITNLLLRLPKIDPTLKTMNVEVIEPDRCSEYHIDRALCANTPKFEGQSYGICFGGAGNTLVHNKKALGIASLLKCDPAELALYTKVRSYVALIRGAILNNPLSNTKPVYLTNEVV